MKCPKCGYLGFDGGDRCKHCGYDFALLGRDETTMSGRDPGLARGARYRQTPDGRSGRGVERRLTPQSEGMPLDLPLFGDGTVPPPRAPIAVRRSTPGPARARVRPTPVARPLELDLQPDAPQPVMAPRPVPAPPPAEPEAVDENFPRIADPARRLTAAAMDFTLLAAIDAVLLAFTLRLCALGPAELPSLPWLPLVAFFVLLDLGYIILFTGTLGQTLGKMAVGIEVVAVHSGGMSLGRAALRTLVSIVSLAPAGLGLLPAVLGSARSLHDWLAGTQVVRTPA